MGATEETLVLTRQLWEQYLNSLEMSNRKTETIRVYRRSMEELYDFLSDDKEITSDTLGDWREWLRECGYSDSTINLRMTAVNGLLKFCDKRNCMASLERIFRNDELPEMTRDEYLHFLSVAQRIGTEQEYLLIKLFATVDIRIQELSSLTVEYCREGVAVMPDGREIIVPPSLGKEIIDYAQRRGIETGAIFITRNGNSLDRSNVARSIRQLAIEAGMDPEKCCPRALHRLYVTTQEELRKKILPIYMQTYDSLLTTEQGIMAMQFV